MRWPFEKSLMEQLSGTSSDTVLRNPQNIQRPTKISQSLLESEEKNGLEVKESKALGG